MVAQVLGLGVVEGPPDVADALALAICHLTTVPLRRASTRGGRGVGRRREYAVIGLLRGPVVLRTGECEVIVDVGGVGYRVTVTPATAAALVAAGAGSEAMLHVHTHVREDAIVLYGFVHDDERRCFEVLLASHGVGPALALAIMAMLSPAALSTAVLEDDLDTLCTVPGVGRKTAARLLIELKSRLDLPDLLWIRSASARRRRGWPADAVRATRTSRAEARAA